MGNDLQLYRASIGSFYSKRYSLPYFKKYFHYHSLHSFIELLFNSLTISWCKFDNILRKGIENLNIIFTIYILLCIISQEVDIEKNPGPDNSESISSDTSLIKDGLTIFHLKHTKYQE